MWSRWRCCPLCSSGIKDRHCWNEKQMLVRNSPDCSSFFHAWALRAASLHLPPSLPPSCVLSPLSAVYILPLLPSFLWQSDTDSTWSYSKTASVLLLLLLRAEEVFLWLHPPIVGRGDSPPLWCVKGGGKERERERGVVVTQGLSFSFPVWGLMSWLWGLPRWQNSCFRAERQEVEVPLAALCVCVCVLL